MTFSAAKTATFSMAVITIITGFLFFIRKENKSKIVRWRNWQDARRGRNPNVDVRTDTHHYRFESCPDYKNKK